MARWEELQLTETRTLSVKQLKHGIGGQTMKEQIEEMAKIICSTSSSRGRCEECGFFERRECFRFENATNLYNAGYRKQSEGEWISNELGGYQYAFHCSECGWVDGYPFNDRHKYCPNCGAKMKGGAE
jgi:hypothetical protein